jgi:chemotaxis protein histidine kinase CheA
MQDSSSSFNPFAPGFDFMQKLAAGGTSSPSHAFGQWQDWVAPTMNVQDLEKRINELKTVMFWLEQNQRALSATIQAMEVQKMTLSALQTMNVPVDNWASTMVQSWQQFAQSSAAQAPDTAAPSAPAASPASPSTSPAAAPVPPADSREAAASEAPSPAAATATDPMQWWGALTQQFQHIAQQAVQDVTEQAMVHAASTQQAAASAAEAVRSTAQGMAEAGKAAAQAAGGLAPKKAASNTAGSSRKAQPGAPTAAPKKTVAPARAAPARAAPARAAPATKAARPKPATPRQR